MASGASMLRDALERIVRGLIEENVQRMREEGTLPEGSVAPAPDEEALRGTIREEIENAGGNAPDEEALRGTIREEIENAGGNAPDEEALRGTIREEIENAGGGAPDEEALRGMIREEIENAGGGAPDEEALRGTIREEIENAGGNAPDEEALRGAVADQVREALEGVRVPTEETIAEIAKREAAPLLEGREDAGGGMEEEGVAALIEEKLRSFAESDGLMARLEEKIESLREETVSEERIAELVSERLTAALEEDAFRSTVEAIAAEKASVSSLDLDALYEPIGEIASKTTEKILAREAEGLVRQIKIELGKIRNEMKKHSEQLGAMLQSPEMAKLIEGISRRAVSKDLEALKGQVEASGVKPADEAALKEMVEEVASRVSEEVSQENLKGFLGDLRSRVQDGIEGQLNEFMESDRWKDAVREVATTAVPAGGGGESEGGGMNTEQVRVLVGEEIRRRTEEAFQEMVPRYVGKFLDDKLPPPEFFESLVSITQVRQEIETRLRGSGSGSAVRGYGSPGGPGESAIFTNMIGRLLSSDELKEMLDDKFRVINNYIKNELIPKTVKKMLKEQ